MKYKKFKRKIGDKDVDYIRWVKETFPKAIYQAPDTDAGKASLDRRRKA